MQLRYCKQCHVHTRPRKLKSHPQAELAETRRLLALQTSSRPLKLALSERYTSPHSTTPHTTPQTTSKMPIKPITGMLRRGLVLDLSVAFGTFAPAQALA